MKSIAFPILAALLLLTYACSPSRSAMEPTGETALEVPPGVDRATAEEAQRLAQESLVTLDEELRAERLKEQAQAWRAESDTIWYYLELRHEEEHRVTEQDNLEAIEAFNVAAEYVRDIDALQRTRSPEDERMLQEYARLVDRAITSFEEALRLNPFDSEVRLWLGQLYGIKASRLNQQQEHKRAIEVLEKLARLERGEHVVYFALAENYFSLENYKVAIENFDRAIRTLRDVAPLSEHYVRYGHMSQRDSTNLFIYTYYKGLSFLQLYDTERSLAIFDEAMALARTDEDRQSVQSEIDFIHWDDGNIRASLEREHIITRLVNQGLLEEAEQRFSALLPTLRSDRARKEIDWRLGVLEYQNGKEKQAAERLRNLVNRTETNHRGQPIDPDHERFFNDFGLISFNIAQRYLAERDRHNALVYFMQSSNINWRNRARANLQIASILSNNVPESIRFANLAHNESYALNDEDRRALYSLLTDLHRRSGDMEQARRYHQMWREI